jgi:hypothetical protein
MSSREENLRLEYDMTQKMAIHYDVINWSIGAIFIAGVLGAIGLSANNINNYWILAIFSGIVLFTWRSYYQRHKAIQQVKFKRLQKIEEELNLRQHRDVDDADEAKQLKGIKGNTIATFISVVIPSTLLVIYFAYHIRISWVH